MKKKEKNSKGVMSLALAAIVILSVLTVGIMPVSGLPTVVRSIEPDTVSAGGVVDVTIEFTTTVSNLFLDINDYVPIGWPVSDMSANIEPDVAEFDPATGEVFFRWIGVPISPGTHIRAEYKLSVPAGWPDVDSYILEGVLQRSTEPRTIPISGDDTVSVKEPSKVSLSVDDNTKVTDANVDAVYYLTVENAGLNVDTYDLAITSNEADFAELSQSSVTLGPGVSDEVVLRVSSFLAGDYDTTVEATSGGASDAITVTTTVEPFYDVSLDASPEAKEVQTNEIATFAITATNQGNAPDVIDLSIIDFGVTSTSADYRQLSDDTFALGVGADATAYFNVTSAAPGVYEKTIKAQSQGDHLVSDMVVTTSTVIPRTKASVPTVTRTITPDTPVAPDDVVNVRIEFTTTDQYVYLYLSDNVPEAWNVPEESMSENSGLPEDLIFLGFDETEGEVYFKWVPIEDPEDPGMEPGTYLMAEYALHVPADAVAGVYDLQGDLTLWTDFASDPSIAFVAGDGTVEVVTGPPDEEPPVITNVASSSITNNSAIITWDTDEVSDSLVKYGTTPGTYTMQGSDATDVTSHSVGLTGLTANTTYYYVVNSTDPSGNSAESGENSFTTWGEGALPDWDINGDRVVDDLDLGLLLLHYGEETESPYPGWDINEDGVVDDLDLGLLLLHYGEEY